MNNRQVEFSLTYIDRRPVLTETGRFDTNSSSEIAQKICSFQV